MAANSSRILLLLFVLFPINVWTYEYCVIGAGPAGLQMGYFLERSGRDYMIFERNAIAGSFFTKYPRHGKLISINKRFTGRLNKEFNLRHDWNSLISDDESLLIRHYSEDFFPAASVMVKYLHDYATKLNLKVQYNTNVTVRKQNNDKFVLKDQHGEEIMCSNVIMSTGLGAENVPKGLRGIEYTESYSDISINPKDYQGQSILIIGRGNSGFETAANILSSANFIHMFARSRVRLSWETHYVGDLRAVNNDLLDTYQLKSLDGLLDLPIEIIGIVKKNGKLYVDTAAGKGADNFAVREPYDRVIRCMGFKFDYSVFENGSSPQPATGKYLKKFPEMTADYESTTVPQLYYAGVNSHYVDFRKSAGGFIHGYRYTTRALHHLLEWKNHGVPWPHTNVPVNDVVGVILKRINEASGIYQMFGVLGEIFIFRSDGTVDYFEEFPLKLVDKFEEHSGHRAGPMVVINMEYGRDYSGPGKDVFRSTRAGAAGVPSVAHLSNFLHPVMYFYKHPPENMTTSKDSVTELPRPDRLHVMVEDFLTLWDAPIAHILLLRRFLEHITQKDLRFYFAQSCFEMSMIYNTVPEECRHHYFEGQMLSGSGQILNKAQALGLAM